MNLIKTKIILSDIQISFKKYCVISVGEKNNLD